MPRADLILDHKSYVKAWEDNGGRRKIKDRRFLPMISMDQEKRTNLKRRAGFDRRIRNGGIDGFEFRQSQSVNF